MLSEQERRQLADMECRLRSEAPDLDRTLCRRPAPDDAVPLVKFALVTAVLLVVGVLTVAPWLIIIGIAAMTGLTIRALLVWDGAESRNHR
jgi:hypothetical protein